MRVRIAETGGPNGPGEPPAATFILTLRLGSHESLSGSIRSADHTTAETFNGWMAFMSVLNRLRDEADLALDEGIV
jgi:hypothetical protein